MFCSISLSFVLFSSLWLRFLHDCTPPYVIEPFETENKKASECKVTRSRNGMSGWTYCMSLEKRICMCIKFEICGISCCIRRLPLKSSPVIGSGHLYGERTMKKDFSRLEVLYFGLHQIFLMFICRLSQTNRGGRR